MGTGEPVERETIKKYTYFIHFRTFGGVLACGSVALYLAILGAFVLGRCIPCLALFSWLYGEIPRMKLHQIRT